MKCKLTYQNCKAFTLAEVIVVLVVLAVVATMLLPTRRRSYNGVRRITCVNNLKQIYTALRIWSGDHNDIYPMQVPGRDGGTLEFANGPEVFRHFQVMSNELGQVPRVVNCPADTERKDAESFSEIVDNSTLGYFLGIDAGETNTTMLVAGDRNLSDTKKIQHGPVAWSTNRSVKWAKGLHTQEGPGAGNILIGDGSVYQASTKTLHPFWQNTGVPTNRLALP
jgi:prepilin-type N-terminal cleavage/methylation domain-containing protein